MLLTAPEYEPTDEPVSLFRIHDGLEIEEEEKEPQKESFKSTLRDVLKKYKEKEVKEEVQEEVEEEKEKITIPDIGRILGFSLN